MPRPGRLRRQTFVPRSKPYRRRLLLPHGEQVRCAFELSGKGFKFLYTSEILWPTATAPTSDRFTAPLLASSPILGEARFTVTPAERKSNLSRLPDLAPISKIDRRFAGVAHGQRSEFPD